MNSEQTTNEHSGALDCYAYSLESLLTSVPYDWWVYDLSQDYAHMLWRCQLVGKVSGKTEQVYAEEFDTPTEAVQSAIQKLHERFGFSDQALCDTCGGKVRFDLSCDYPPG